MHKSLAVILLFALMFVSQSAFASSSVEIISLLDVQGTANTSLLVGASDSQIKEYVPSGKLNSQILAFFVKTPEHNILFDAGLKGGNVAKRLLENGVKAEDVKVILLTHLHPDHFGGLVDGENKAAFPNAEVYVGRVERDYWFNDVKNESVINAINLYGERVHVFDFGDEVISGVKALDACGHTPGHTVFEVNHEALIVGDIMHFAEIQMPLPDISVKYDVDPVKAAESRKKILDYASENNITVAGMHITPPGIYKVKKAGTGYEF